VHSKTGVSGHLGLLRPETGKCTNNMDRHQAALIYGSDGPHKRWMVSLQENVVLTSSFLSSAFHPFLFPFPWELNWVGYSSDFSNAPMFLIPNSPSHPPTLSITRTVSFLIFLIEHLLSYYKHLWPFQLCPLTSWWPTVYQVRAILGMRGTWFAQHSSDNFLKQRHLSYSKCHQFSNLYVQCMLNFDGENLQ